MKNLLIISILLFAACTTPAEHSDSTNTEETADSTSAFGVDFLNIADLDTLESPFILEMGVEGMKVEPKGPPREGYGHHHLFINDGFYDKGVFIAADSTHIHYGDGSTVDTVSLNPGKYLLTLQFADGMHVSYGEEWSKSITVIVK